MITCIGQPDLTRDMRTGGHRRTEPRSISGARAEVRRRRLESAELSSQSEAGILAADQSEDGGSLALTGE